VIAWRAWGLTGRAEDLRLQPVGPFSRPWSPGRPAEARCERWRFHRAPAIDCSCGVHGIRDFELLRRVRGRAVIGTVALWGTIVEHEEGYRARFGYPLEVGIVCPICFSRQGGRQRPPDALAQLRRGDHLPLCDEHLATASAVGLSTRRLIRADVALEALVKRYGVGVLSPMDDPRVVSLCLDHEATPKASRGHRPTWSEI
jgi:hypothetical protein